MRRPVDHQFKLDWSQVRMERGAAWKRRLDEAALDFDRELRRLGELLGKHYWSE